MCAVWKKKNERNEIVCFYSAQSDILLCGIAKFIRGNKSKLRTFQPQKWKNKKNSQRQTKLTDSYKKKSVVLSLMSCVNYAIGKKILPCLNWLTTCFQFQNMFFENFYCFQFWWKTKRCTNNYVISCFKTFFACTLRLIKCFQFQDMIWKTEECRVSKNIELKIWR